jgi:hypothetical protein
MARRLVAIEELPASAASEKAACSPSVAKINRARAVRYPKRTE